MVSGDAQDNAVAQKIVCYTGTFITHYETSPVVINSVGASNVYNSTTGGFAVAPRRRSRHYRHTTASPCRTEKLDLLTVQ